MNYNEYIKYYEWVQTLEELTSKKLALWSVIIEKENFEIIKKLDDFSIIKIWDYKYIVLKNNTMVYTIAKKIYEKYEDFKINSCSVFRLKENITY